MSAEAVSRLNADSSAETGQLFVINLCASTSPMALSHPNTPELKRYTFFVSRQREDGRERFRLHMGYFNSQEDAEAMLSRVRDVYPAAWAGPAPTSGVPRRGRVAAVPSPARVASASTQAAPVAAEPAVVQTKPEVAQPAARAASGAQPASVQPEKVAPAASVEPVAATVRVEPAAAPGLEAMSNVRDVLARLSDEAPAREPQPRAAVPARSEAAKPAQAAKAAEPAKAPVTAKPAIQPPKVQAAKPEAAKREAAKPIHAAKPAPAIKPVPATAPRPGIARTETPELDASQTLRVLEETIPAAHTAVATAAAQPAAPAATVQARDVPSVVQDNSEVRVVTPEDTQTLQDIQLDAENNAPPCFAVQLVWAVAPIDVSALPHLAIFDAYTLYNVEGSRQGRKWYGLRLGFFSDPNSATSVAHYVRSDYPTVAVVPVANKERDHAKGGAGPGARLGEAAPALKPEAEVNLEKQGLDGFELLQDDRPRPEKRDVDDIGKAVAAKPVANAGARPAANAAPKSAAAAKAPVVSAATRPAGVTAASAAAAGPRAAGRPTGKRVVVRQRPQQPTRAAAPGAPNPLESTLDILGASTLTLDESREIVNDSAIRKPIEKKSGSRFSKLLSRLSGS